MAELSEIVDKYMAKTTGLKEFCDRCLRTQRWNGNVVLMIVDAAFDSIGLNYFTAIVPKVMEFEKSFVENRRVKNLKDLSNLSHEQVKSIWGNKRSWKVAQSVASYLHGVGERKNLSDKRAFRSWHQIRALRAGRKSDRRNQRCRAHTYQYLRMMGGIDTAIPDKTVRRVIEKILDGADANMPIGGDLELIRTIERIAEISGCKPIELCWMT